MAIPDTVCTECEYREETPVGEEHINPQLRSCPECAAPMEYDR